jgi:hypothetical protein
MIGEFVSAPSSESGAAPAAARQKRGRKIAMTAEELNDFLSAERVCRVATVSADGPHATPLWFVWDGTSLWLNSLSKSQRSTDLDRDNRVAVVIDGGEAYDELHGVELRGRAEVVGEVPRTGEPNEELPVPERLFSQKYGGSDTMSYDGRHAWRRITPDKISSWDFRKLGL